MDFCYKCTTEVIGQESSGPDWITILFAGAAVFVTIYVVFLGKRVEIKINKFNKLCFEPLEIKFDVLQNILEDKKNDDITLHLNTISEISADFTLVLTQIKHIYPKLNVDELQDMFHDNFTDIAFANGTNKMYTILGDFLKTKITILEKVYDYALFKELKIFSIKHIVRFLKK